MIQTLKFKRIQTYQEIITEQKRRLGICYLRVVVADHPMHVLTCKTEYYKLGLEINDYIQKAEDSILF